MDSALSLGDPTGQVDNAGRTELWVFSRLRRWLW